jgi:hypothetical protein
MARAKVFSVFLLVHVVVSFIFYGSLVITVHRLIDKFDGSDGSATLDSRLQHSNRDLRT